MANLRFCAYQYQHLAFPQLYERWGRAEQLSFETTALGTVDGQG